MNILIVGTLGGHVTTATKLAIEKGASVSQINSMEEALSYLRLGQGGDLVLFDVTLDIKTFIASLIQERIHTPVIACGVSTDSRPAVDAIKAGAEEYIPFPPDPELIAGILEEVSQQNEAFLFKDDKMKHLIQLVQRVAPSNATVLITGESGTGKEVMARYIHRKSTRKSQRFVSVNCAAIPENLLESELFGHEKGAFTGAVARRIGKFEEAHGGTLLLDEISEMDPRLQAKLLRAIQEREIDRVGGSKPVSVDIRLLATSNRDLKEAVQNGNFREDLYFRLNVFSIHIPPLRERPGDIENLAQYFNEKYSRANNLSVRSIQNAAMEKLKKYPWSGNVRELENIMHRTAILALGENITENDILLTDGGADSKSPVESLTESQDMMVGKTVAQVEQTLIMNTLNHCYGNRTRAANILGISIRTLRNKLKQYSEDGVKAPPTQDAFDMRGRRA